MKASINIKGRLRVLRLPRSYGIVFVPEGRAGATVRMLRVRSRAAALRLLGSMDLGADVASKLIDEVRRLGVAVVDKRVSISDLRQRGLY